MPYIIIYPQFHASFVPTEGLLQGWHLSDSQNQKTCCFHKAKKLHREDLTQRGLYTELLFHRRFCTQTLLHTEAFTQKSLLSRSLTTRSLYTQPLYIQKLFHKKVFAHRNFNAQVPKLLHTGAFAHTHTRPYTKKLLDTETFTALSQGSCYTEAFAQRCLYKQKLLHT